MRDDDRERPEEAIAAFLAALKQYAKGTKMSFLGFKKEEDIVSTIEYLRSFESFNLSYVRCFLTVCFFLGYRKVK